jgi:competence protein ComEC
MASVSRAGGERSAPGRLGEALGRHPRHLALAALGTGLALAGHVQTAAIVAAVSAAVFATLRGPTAPLAVLAAAALVPAGALAGGARLAAIDHSDLTGEAGGGIELVGHVIRREPVLHGVRRFRVAATAYRRGAGRWRALAEGVQLRTRAAPARVAIGDEIRATGRLSRPAPGEGRFDYAAYLRRAGIRTVLDAERARLTGRRRGGMDGALDTVRNRAERGVSAGLPSSMAALARGMVLGADEDIPPGMSDDFKASGLAHVLAVSGQNVALLAALAWPLLAAAGLRRRGRLAGVAALIALYVPLTGDGPSVVRAGVMGLAAVVAAFAGRPASRWYALLLAAVATLILDPRAWQDVGWQLSFAAVAGIFVLARPLAALVRPLPEPLRMGAALTVAATLATAPLAAFHFERVSLAALPANLAALPAIPLVMWTGMLSAAAGQVWMPAAELLNALNGFCLAYVAAVARWGARLPFAVAETSIAGPGQLALVYAVLAAVLAAAWRLSATRRGGAAALAGVGIAATAAAALLPGAGPPAPPGRFTVTFLDVGQGDATLLQAPGGRAALVDGGPPEAGVAARLSGHGVRTLDLVVLTHAQEDHQGGLEEVLSRFPVGVLLDGAHPADGADHRAIVALARRRGVRVVPAAAGQRLMLGPGLRIDVLAPRSALDAPHGLDPNMRAVVLRAGYRGLDVLLPADAESDVTAALAPVPVEVLKVAHHGSADEGIAGLLRRLRPAAAVIPVGARNRYGHPHPATLRALAAAVPRVYRTDRDGDVTLTLGRSGPAIRSGR